jgi:hypothetical protein
VCIVLPFACACCTVALCCPSHYGSQVPPVSTNGGLGTNGFTPMSGSNFEISLHGGTPCAYYEATLQPNVETSICCPTRWASGIFFAQGAQTTTMTTTTTDNGIYRDANQSFHQAFTQLAAVVQAVHGNTQIGQSLSTLISLVVLTNEAADNATQASIAAMSTQVAGLMATQTALSGTVQMNGAADVTTQASIAAMSTQITGLTSTQTALSGTVQTISAAIARATSTMSPVSPATWQCPGSGCAPAINSNNNDMAIASKSGTVRIQTATCGEVDICSMANALNALRGA